MVNNKTQKIYGGFTRLRDFPLDPTTVFDNMTDFVKYMVYNKTIYEGQLCVVKGNSDESGVYEIKLDRNNGQFTYSRIAKDADVIKNAEDIAVLFNDLRDKHAQIIVNKNNIETLTNRLDNDYVTNSTLHSEIERIIGSEYEELDGTLNDISDLSRRISELLRDIRTKIDSDTVLAAFDEYDNDFATLTESVRVLSERTDITVANIRNRLDGLDAAIADILPRILDDNDVLEIVDDRGLFNVIKVREFTFTTSHGIDSEFNFKANDVIKSISFTPTVAPNVAAELIPTMIHLDDSYSNDNIIADGIFTLQAGVQDIKYHMENINYTIKKDAHFSVTIPSDLNSSFAGIFRIEYFRKS